MVIGRNAAQLTLTSHCVFRYAFTASMVPWVCRFYVLRSAIATDSSFRRKLAFCAPNAFINSRINPRSLGRDCSAPVFVNVLQKGDSVSDRGICCNLMRSRRSLASSAAVSLSQSLGARRTRRDHSRGLRILEGETFSDLHTRGIRCSRGLVLLS